jgi:hypothetical protein
MSPDDLPTGYNAVRIYERGTAILDTGITLTEPDMIDIQFSYSQYNGFNVSCVDCFNGTITTTVTGGTAPYTYQWEDANYSTTANLSNLNGGDYPLFVTDAKGCRADNIAQLTMPTPKDWSRGGNANIDTSEFIGSTDSSALRFKTNNQEVLKLSAKEISFSKKIHFSPSSLDLSTFDQQFVNSCNFQLPVISPTGQLTTMQQINNAIKHNIANNIAAGSADTVICPDSTQFGQTWSLLGNDLSNYGFTPKLGATSNHDLKIITNNQLRMIVKKGTGNVGIGITSPQYKLDVEGKVNATGFLRDGEELRGSQWSEGTNPDNICYTLGNVGIGTCDPMHKLHIKGTATSIALENTNNAGSIIKNNFIIESANGAARLISDNGLSIFIDADNNNDENTTPHNEFFKIAKNDGSFSGNEVDLF